jgi:hypothetical protein
MEADETDRITARPNGQTQSYRQWAVLSLIFLAVLLWIAGTFWRMP